MALNSGMSAYFSATKSDCERCSVIVWLLAMVGATIFWQRSRVTKNVALLTGSEQWYARVFLATKPGNEKCCVVNWL